MAVLLFLSLAANVFMVGRMSVLAVAGHHAGPPMMQTEERRPPRSGGFEDPFRIMHDADGMSPELRDAFRESFRAQLPEMREFHKQMRGLRRELGVLMSAEDWDAAAIDAKLDEIKALQARQQDAFTDAFTSVFETLPADERKRLIDSANERRKARYDRFRQRRSGGDDAPPPPDEE